MQIYEVKNDIADILYATDENNLFLSDFLFIEDEEQTIIAQITDISTTERAEINIATVKFYISVDKDNKLTPYNGHTPAKDSDVGRLDPQEIIGLFRPKSKELVWGNYIRNSQIKVSTDLKFLSSNACIICDKAEPAKNLIKNLLNSLDKNNVNSIVFDFEGKFRNIKSSKRLVFGKDYRIPLDILALEYIFNNELDELPVISKAIVQNIILEIEKYIETLPNGFIPFDLFAKIVADECQNSKDSGLLIFSNKLSQYKQRKIFANEVSQFQNINELKGSSILDISDTDIKFHKLIFASTINTISGKFYLFADISEDNANNEIIKRIYEKNNIRLIPICKNGDKYLTKLKQYSNNYILFPPAAQLNSNEPYSSFINKLSQNDFILYGEGTLLIPLVVTMSKSQFDLKESETSFDQVDLVTYQDLDDLDFINIQSVLDEEQQQEQQKDSISDKKKEIIEEPVISEVQETTSQEPDTDITDEIENVQESTNDLIQVIYPEDREEIYAPIKELENQQNAEDDENYEDQVIPITDDNELTSDIQNDVRPVEQNQNIQRQNQRTPINDTNEKPRPKADELPIYSPKELSQNEIQNFETGNRVNHAKYGTGIVEKIMSYGNKTLCCIQFDKVGRKLLDPSVTKIEKIF